MSDKLRLFNSEIHDSLYDENGRVKDQEIAHEMTKIEDPYHKRDAFGLIKPRQYRIKKGERLAEAAGEKLFQQKQELARKEQEYEYEKNLSEHSQPKEPATVEIGQGKELHDPQLLAKYAINLLLQDWPHSFPLNKEVELLECTGNFIPSHIFNEVNADFPYETFQKELVGGLANALRKQGFGGKAVIKPEFKLAGPPDEQKIEDMAKNKELYIRICLYYDEPGADLLPKIKINITRLPQTTALIKTK